MPDQSLPATTTIRSALESGRIGKSGTGLNDAAATHTDSRDHTALASTSCGKLPDLARDSP